MRSVHLDTARTWRGGQNQVLLTVRGLPALGHDVVLVAHEHGELLKRAAATVKTIGLLPRSEFDVQAAWQLRRIFDEERPDVVHAHDPMAVSLTAMALQMAGAPPRRPLVVAARRVDFHLKHHAFSRWKYRSVDVFIAASRVIAQILVADGIDRDRIEVVHDGVDLAAIDAEPAVDAHAAFWLPHGAPIVGNVAALASHKGQAHLVSAAAEVVRAHPDTRFLIVGEGELREPLERRIRELGLERHVLLTGFRPDAIGLMKSFDVFAMSSITEGLGSAILEAMACGRAVVATTAGGIPEAVVDRETGLLVPPRHDAEMAAALLEVLRDRALRDRLGRAGRARVSTAFSVDQLVAGTAAVYEARRPRS
ncbi:MAG: glycosyltransferase [Acidobacteria bacterium]|nr:glycosyltransferase [Acidobacteriota bacterium]